MIKQLQTDTEKWIGNNYLFNGSIDTSGKNVKYFCFPEQDYLTQYFTGKWHMIDGIYASWGKHNDDDIYGIHMAALTYNINGIWKNSKSWMIQIPIDDGYNIITNKMACWGIINYPKLKKILMKDLVFYIDKILVDIKNIKSNSDIYNKLTKYQKYVIDLINL
jgi:hypothetical protein